MVFKPENGANFMTRERGVSKVNLFCFT